MHRRQHSFSYPCFFHLAIKFPSTTLTEFQNFPNTKSRPPHLLSDAPLVQLSADCLLLVKHFVHVPTALMMNSKHIPGSLLQAFLASSLDIPHLLIQLVQNTWCNSRLKRRTNGGQGKKKRNRRKIKKLRDPLGSRPHEKRQNLHANKQKEKKEGNEPSMVSQPSGFCFRLTFNNTSSVKGKLARNPTLPSIAW